MRIHKDDFYEIIQDVITEHDERIRITIKFIEPMSFFRKDMYADVMSIIKSLMHKKEYVCDHYNYPEHTTRYILGVYNKIIHRLCNYTYERCSGYRSKDPNCDTLVSTMFNASEPIEPKKTPDGKFIILEASDVGKFFYPPINYNL